MSKVKDWAYDQVQTQIDQICLSYKDEIITRQEAIEALMKIEHSDIYIGDHMDHFIASEILDDVRGGVYA